MKTNNLRYLMKMFLLSAVMGDKEMQTFRGHNYIRGGYNPEFHPRRTKFKGWMRENRKCTFNKNK